MTIMIIDDSPHRCRRVEEALETIGVECITFSSLLPGIRFLKMNDVDGIVTDMQYPISDKPNSDVKEAGKILLKWLVFQKKEIPVLGNSHCQFNTSYPYYKGQLPGYYQDWQLGILKEFVSSMDHSK